MKTAAAGLFAVAVLAGAVALGVGAWVDHCLTSVTIGGQR